MLPQRFISLMAASMYPRVSFISSSVMCPALILREISLAVGEYPAEGIIDFMSHGGRELTHGSHFRDRGPSRGTAPCFQLPPASDSPPCC